MMAANILSRPQTTATDIVSSQPSNPSTSHGRRLRENLTSSHSVLSQSSYVSSNTLAERRAEGQQQLLHKQEVLRQDIERNQEVLRASKAELQKVSTSLILENTRMLKKQAEVETAGEDLQIWQQKAVAAKRVHQIAKVTQEEQMGITQVAQQAVQDAAAAVEAETKRLKNAKGRVEELELTARRTNEAWLDSDRIKDKELLRLRRAREVSETDRVRVIESERLVAPLQEPFFSLKAEFAPLDYAAAEAEERQLASRTHLTQCQKSEYDLAKVREGYLTALPKLREYRDEGYIKRSEATYSLDQAARFIVEHRYQQTFFRRSYQNTAPSPLDGSVLEAVGNMKDREYTDSWGDKGIGIYVVKDRIEEMIHKLEIEAVIECETNLKNADRDFEIAHEELFLATNRSERATHEAQRRRALADETSAKIGAAQERLEFALQAVAECQARAGDSLAAMLAQTEVTENALITAKRCAEDAEQARMKADLEMLLVEDLEEVCAGVRSVHTAAQESVAAAEQKLASLSERLASVKEAADAACKEEEEARTKRQLREAELGLQQARRAKSLVKQQEMEGEVKLALRQREELEEQLRASERLYHSEHTRETRHATLAGLRVQQRGCEQAVKALRKEVEQEAAAGRPRDAAKDALLAGLEHHSETCVMNLLVGAWDEVQRGCAPSFTTYRPGSNSRRNIPIFGSHVLGEALTATPALGRSAALCFRRMAKVFQVTNQGATILKASPSSRPVELKGWVAQSTNKGELKYSALSAEPIVGGRHSWSCVVEQFSGKGLLLLGVVQDATAADAAPVTEHRVIGRCDASTVRRGSRFEACTSESYALDLNSWCLGECHKSWALCSDGVKMHGGVVTDFTGSNIESGCIVKVLLDLHRKTLTFSLNGKQLGQVMQGVEGPVIPAISVTRTATCRVTFCDYWRT